MTAETVTARELAVLVKPVRALLKQNKKIEAIKLVRKRTGCGLKESLVFVQHVQSWPGARAVKVAQLRTSARIGESISNMPDHNPTPAGTSNGDATEKLTGHGHMACRMVFALYGDAHLFTVGGVDPLCRIRTVPIEKCLIAKTTEEQL